MRGATAETTPAAACVTGPSIIRSTQRAFVAPVASSTIRFACRIVAIPIDSASRGTAPARLPNSGALARRVAGFRRVRCVRATSARAGSLKPMWPLHAEPEDLHVDAAGAFDRALVAIAFALDVPPGADGAVQKVDAAAATG